MEKTFDALIVGAGPAGSFAAELLARQGARVALFDGRPSLEPKACGGGVTSKGLKAYPFLLDAAARTIDEVLMYAPKGQRIELKLEEPFAIFSRRNLDAHLRERARKSGAEVFDERVTLASDVQNNVNSRIEVHSIQSTGEAQKLWCVRNRAGTQWRGNILIAADGANSPIAKKLAGALPNSEMEVAFGYRAPFPMSDDAPTVIAFLPGYAGYAWAFPRLDHISFGIATAQSTFKHKALDGMLWQFIVNYYCAQQTGEDGEQLFGENGRDAINARLESELREIVEPYAARIPGLSPQAWDTRSVAGANWALLGDAAGFADPVTGEGIYYALRSSELFAQSFAAGSVESFEAMWRADFGRELRRAGEMRSRFYGTFLGAPFTERMIQLALASRGIRRTIRELIAGEQGYLDLKRKLAVRAIAPFAS